MSRALIAAAAAVLVLAGCTTDGHTASSQATETAVTATTSPDTTHPETLATGSFALTHGISGDVTIERDADATAVVLDSFRPGGHQTRLLLVDADDADLTTCVPASATTVSVGGTPAAPTSRFSLVDGSAPLPRFTAAVLLGQRSGDADAPSCEPILSIAPLAWVDAAS